jgi:hypothetical protein
VLGLWWPLGHDLGFPHSPYHLIGVRSPALTRARFAWSLVKVVTFITLPICAGQTVVQNGFSGIAWQVRRLHAVRHHSVVAAGLAFRLPQRGVRPSSIRPVPGHWQSEVEVS